MNTAKEPEPLKTVTSNDEPKKLHPYCQVCGWRKGGIDSWNGVACKCKHSEPPMRPLKTKDPIALGDFIK